MGNNACKLNEKRVCIHTCRGSYYLLLYSFIQYTIILSRKAHWKFIKFLLKSVYFTYITILDFLCSLSLQLITKKLQLKHIIYVFFFCFLELFFPHLQYYINSNIYTDIYSHSWLWAGEGVYPVHLLHLEFSFVIQPSSSLFR